MKLKSLLENKELSRKWLKIHSMFVDGLEDDRWDIKVSNQGVFKFEAPGKIQIGPVQLPNIDNRSVNRAKKELFSNYRKEQYSSLISIDVNERELRVKGNVIATFLLSDAHEAIDLLTNSTTFESLNELIINCIKVDDYEEIEMIINHINEEMKIL